MSHFFFPKIISNGIRSGVCGVESIQRKKIARMSTSICSKLRNEIYAAILGHLLKLLSSFHFQGLFHSWMPS